MDKLLQQMWNRFLRIGERVVEALEEGVDYQALQEQLERELKGVGRAIMQSVIEAADERLRSKPSERPGWVVTQRGHEKELLTRFGRMRYHRTYFRHKATKEHRYLVDEAMGFTAHQRVDVGLKADLVERATERSYRESGSWCREMSWQISGQTVMSACRTLETGGVSRPKMASGKRRVRYLFIQADEDHVPSQEGPRWQPRLVTVHEGIEGSAKRKRLVRAKRFGGVYTAKTLGQLYEAVWTYLDETYDLEQKPTILVSGDGASWIRGVCEYIPDAVFILDRFHARKYALAATAGEESLYGRLWKALQAADRQQMRKVLDEAEKGAETAAQRRRIEEARQYFKGQWDGIKAWQKYRDVWPGCSAEGDVSHVYAARLSSRPMAWRRRGVDQMSRMRVMRANGESVRTAYLSQHGHGLSPIQVTQETLRKARRQIRESQDLGRVLTGALPSLGSYTRPLQKALRGLMNGH